MKMLNVALIGCGVISDNHLAAILGNENAKLVALCDIRKERAEQKLSKYGINANVYSDYIEMLNCEKLDVVHIATPHYLHAEMTLEALSRDINVFLEKPMCINNEEIERIISAEKESKGKICVCFQNRFNPATIYAKDLCDRDGGAITAFGSLFWERNAAYYGSDPWRGKIATEGGGVMINQAIHTIDLLCYFLGKPEKICATCANHSLKGIIEVEDTCEGVIEFSNGKRGNFYATNSFRNSDLLSFTVITKNHIIEMRNFKLFIDDELINLEKIDLPILGKACYGHGHKDVIDLFYSSIILGTESPVTAQSAQYALRTLLAAYKSNDEFVPV